MRTTNRTYIGFALFVLLALFVVSCGDGGGWRGEIAPVPTTAPSAPEALAATVVNAARIDLSWKPVSDAEYYTLYRGTASGIYSVVTASLLVTTLTDTAVTAGTTYFYAVSATNAIGEGDLSVEVSGTPATQGATKVIVGTIKYEDREYDAASGLTGNTSLKAVRFAEVQLVSGAATVWTTRTTSTGLYSIASSTLNGDLSLRVYASSNPVGTQKLEVKSLTPVIALYTVSSGVFQLIGNTNLNLAVGASNAADGAFNILDVFNSGFQFVYSMASSTPTTNLNAYWQLNNADGTYYCPPSSAAYCSGGEGIYVKNDPNSRYPDTDEFDDDVLWHEFGHFTLQHFSRDDSPGGAHYLNDNTEDLRLSWSEGWGNFFETAVKYWLNATDPSLLSQAAGVPLSQYTDTEVGGIYISLNIADPESSTYPCTYGTCSYCSGFECYYASNEISIARTLWHIMDPNGLGMAPIWNSLASHMTATIVPSAKLEDFWDGWLITNGTGDLPTLRTVFNERLIRYDDDVFGADDNTMATAQTFTVGVAQNHTLYSDPTATTAGDVDFVLFTVPATTANYTIRTTGLKNGPDTYLTLFSSTGTTLANNDNTNGTTYVLCVDGTPNNPPGCNYGTYDRDGFYVFPPNDGTTLGSSITWNLGPGDYFVSVRTSPNRPVSAGRYGSYTLTITTP